MTDPLAVEHLLVGLAPEGSGVASSRVGLVSMAELSEGERGLVDGSVPSRREEFAAGRSCAHRALRAIGADTSTIGRGPRRQPVWPAGVTGSISHTAAVAAAVAVLVSPDVRGLGLDVERVDAIDDELWAQVLTARERAACEGSGDRGVTAAAVFGAKEAAFKALFPLVAVEIDLLEVEASLGADGGVAVVDVPRLATSVTVRQGRVGALVVSVATVAGGGPADRS